MSVHRAQALRTGFWLLVAALAFSLPACGGGGGSRGGGLGREPVPPAFLDASTQVPTGSARLVAAADLAGGGPDVVLAGDGSPVILRNTAGVFTDVTTIVD